MLSEKLQVGQVIELRERGNGFEFAVVQPGEPGHEVLEVGPEYVVIKGDDNTAWVRYPAYLLRPREATPPAPPPATAAA
jgi:hypothetical protein